MNKSESKYFNTALLMDEALAALLAEKDFEFITVKEICAKAGVNRSTFYLHYDTVDDLLAETVENSMANFLSGFSVTPEEFIPRIEKAELKDLVLINRQFLRPYLTFIRDNKNIYRAAFRNPATMQTDKQMDSTAEYVLKPILNRFRIPENEQAYWMAYHIQGCMAIVKEWLARDCSDSAEDVMRIMTDCIRPYMSESEK